MDVQCVRQVPHGFLFPTAMCAIDPGLDQQVTMALALISAPGPTLSLRLILLLESYARTVRAAETQHSLRLIRIWTHLS